VAVAWTGPAQPTGKLGPARLTIDCQVRLTTSAPAPLSALLTAPALLQPRVERRSPTGVTRDTPRRGLRGRPAAPTLPLRGSEIRSPRTPRGSGERSTSRSSLRELSLSPPPRTPPSRRSVLLASACACPALPRLRTPSPASSALTRISSLRSDSCRPESHVDAASPVHPPGHHSHNRDDAPARHDAARLPGPPLRRRRRRSHNPNRNHNRTSTTSQASHRNCTATYRSRLDSRPPRDTVGPSYVE